MTRLLLIAAAAIAAIVAAAAAPAPAHAGGGVTLRVAGTVVKAKPRSSAPRTSSSPRQSQDALWGVQWSAHRTRVAEAWARAAGPAPIVAVLDSGVDASHPDLAGKLVPGYDTVNEDSDPSDDHGHGTAVAGIIGAVTNNRVGVASFCPGCLLMAVKVLPADGVGTDTDVAEGIVWAVDHGARVLNLSLGGPDDSQVLRDAIAYALARGAVVVAAAGNEGVEVPFFPAAYPGVISVAATDQSDSLYSWSNRGPWVTLAAPGMSATTVLGGGYGWFSGTSAAAPVVAGIAALSLSAQRPGQAFAPDRLARGAVAVAGAGAGRVDAAAAVA